MTCNDNYLIRKFNIELFCWTSFLSYIDRSEMTKMFSIEWYTHQNRIYFFWWQTFVSVLADGKCVKDGWIWIYGNEWKNPGLNFI